MTRTFSTCKSSACGTLLRLFMGDHLAAFTSVVSATLDAEKAADARLLGLDASTAAAAMILSIAASAGATGLDVEVKLLLGPRTLRAQCHGDHIDCS
jgi:hypothetical protein